MNNPYTIDPVYGDRFYGRQRLVLEILSGANNQMLIIGARRMGKSSLLQHVEYKLDSTPDVGLYFQLVGPVSTLEDFRNQFEFACRLEPELFEKFSIDVEKVFSGTEDIREILFRLNEHLKRNGTRFFLLVDEADNLAGLDDYSLELRACFERKTQIRLILAAAQGIYKLREKSEKSARFLNNIWIETLPPLEKEEAEELIRQNQNEPSIDVSHETISEIQHLTGNRPYNLQVLCRKLFNESGCLMTVSQNHLDEMYSMIIRAGIMETSYCLLNPLQQEIVNHISENGRVFSKSPFFESRAISAEELKYQIEDYSEAAAIQNELNELTKLGYLKGGARIGYSISNYFFQKWLSATSNKPESIFESTAPPRPPHIKNRQLM